MLPNQQLWYCIWVPSLSAVYKTRTRVTQVGHMNNVEWEEQVHMHVAPLEMYAVHKRF